MLRYVLTVCLLTTVFNEFSQINTNNIIIARDSYGVPHIFGKTDAEVAYGLAWAHAEDDFRNIQENLLAAKSMLGAAIGKEGLLFDFFVQYVGIDDLVEERYDKDISDDFKKVLSAYVQALNRYAELHPEEVLYKKALPFTEKDVIKGYCAALNLFSGAALYLKDIFQNQIKRFAENDLPTGSNAIAIKSTKSADGKTYLVVNPHNSYEGRYSWYEAHTKSEEGTDMNGALFAGGVTVFLGFNENLSWAHTFNYHDLVDVYELETNKARTKYKIDGEWLPLKKDVAKVKLKVGGLRIGVKRKFYQTIYGPALGNKYGVFATAIATNSSIKAAEQWYRMGRAKNYEQYMEALKTDGFPLLNIVYADKEDNIMYLSQAHYPIRKPGFNYDHTLKGNTKANLWDGFIPFDLRPLQFNPECGYLFNANNSPLNATCDENNLDKSICKTIIGLQTIETNRSYRFNELFENTDKLTLEDIKRIKYDVRYPSSGYVIEGMKRALKIDTTAFKDIADVWDLLNSWNRSADISNTAAMLFIHYADQLVKILGMDTREYFTGTYQPTERQIYAALKNTKEHYLKNFGKLEIPLGEMQRHIRGNKDYPIDGITEVPAPTHSKLMKNGKYKATGGDSFIQFVAYGPEGVTAESVHAYGSSARPESKHYNDQMELFVNKKTKRVLTDKEEILKTAEKIYHPQ